MKRLTTIIILFASTYYSLTLFLGCNGSQTKLSNEKSTDSAIYPADLNPSMFASRNITTSDVKKFLPYSNSDYSDSLKKITYKAFDSTQDAKYLQPLMPDIGLWAFQTVRLLSWQDKIGELQPYIVTIDGEDYDGMEYVVLDKNYKPVSEITIRGGWSVNDDDSTGYMIHNITHATFHENVIMLYKLRVWLWVADSVKHPCLIDSVTCKAIIMPDGSIETTKLDSIRHERHEDSDFYRF